MQAEALGPVDSNERIEISVIVRPRHELTDLDAQPNRPMSREEFDANYGADPADLKRIETFAQQHDLEVLEASQGRRTVRLAGRVADISAAFGVSLQRERSANGTVYRTASGPMQVPDDLRGVVQGVFGLDTRPVAHPRAQGQQEGVE